MDPIDTLKNGLLAVPPAPQGYSRSSSCLSGLEEEVRTHSWGVLWTSSILSQLQNLLENILGLAAHLKCVFRRLVGFNLES